MTGLTMRRLSTALSAAFVMAALASVSTAATIRRVAHTATLLTSGDVLITGGVDETGAILNSADMVAATRGPAILPITATMAVRRSSHTATLMANGCVLIVGGNSALTEGALPVPENRAEIYNPATGLFTFTSNNMTKARYNHTATLLNTGNVLVCGGQDAAGVTVPGATAAKGSCELYTPTSCAAGTFGAAPDLLQGRYNHTAILLKDGKVWFAGGVNPAIAATGGYLPTTERYDPGSNTFQSASPLIEARSQHTATLMGDGRALVVGGYNKRDVIANKGVTESAEIYDPISNSVTPAASMTARRHAHAAALSANGTVDILGGLGNITTTYTNPTAKFDSGSALVMGAPITLPTATINAGLSTGLIPLNFFLDKPVRGVIQNGEMWLSSPTVTTTWGMVAFVPSDQLVPATGVRVNLAGTEVGCDPDSGACGKIQTAVGASAALSQMQGQAVFNRRTGVTTTDALPTAGALAFTPTPIDTTTLNAILVPAGSNITATITIPMDNALIGSNINSGNLTITDGSIKRANVFFATLTGATAATIPASPVTPDVDGNGQAVITGINFTNLAGTIIYQGSDGKLDSGAALNGSDTVSLTMRMTYTTDGADLTNEVFKVDIATVVIRKMVFADHETYDPQANAWTIAPFRGETATDQRYGLSATLLNNNDTVLYGGRACQGAVCATQTANAKTLMEVVYSEKNFAAAGGSSGQRAFHTTTLMPNGDLLVAGGTNGPSIRQDAEIFHPDAVSSNETFSPTAGSMRYVRDLHTATLLPNGRVLIAGGFTTNATSTGSTKTSEIYYPDTKVFLETDSMISSRSNHSAILLPNGNVFVAGGFGPGDVITGTSEVYISTKGRWEAAAAMPALCERAIHATVQLKDGRILLIGGVNASGPLSSSARYDPGSDTWDCASVALIGAGTPSGVVALRSHTATLLFDGRVLVAGGNDGLGEANASYIYDPTLNSWTATDPLPLLQARFNHTATLLPNGNVMITGGSQKFGNVPAAIEVFHVNASSWVTNGVTFAAGPRAFHTMTLALNNKLYGIGGSDGVIGGNGVTLYKSAEEGYFTATPDAFTKNSPPSFRQSTVTTTSPATFLPGGRLTVTGNQFRGGTEASGGGAASGNSAFSFPHLILQQVDGSGGAASQSNGGFVVDLTTQIFINSDNFGTLNSSVTVALPPTSSSMPYGWYALRTAANDLFSNGKLVQVGPVKPLTAPTGIAGAVQGISSMTWTWTAIAGVDGYNVYNATTGVFLTTIPALGSPRYVQTALDPSATTSILIAGYTLLGDGPLGASPTSYTLPTTPINLATTSVTSSEIGLEWGTNGNSFPGTRYEVTESSTDTFTANVSTPVPLLSALTTNFTIISNLAANTTYFFRVRAFSPVGSVSVYSSTVSAQTRAPVTQPTVVSRTATSIVWQWPDPGSVNNYRVFNATTGVLLATPVTNSFTEVARGTNTANAIMVSAVTNAGEGPLSPSATAYTAAVSPGLFAPPIPLSALTTGSILLNLNNDDNPLGTQYRYSLLEFASDGSSMSLIVSTVAKSAAPLSQGFGSLIPSTLFRYEIVAVNGDGIDSDTPAAVFGSTWTLPTAPTLLTALGTTATDISIGWNANNNSSSATYQVSYSTDSNFANPVSTPLAFADNFKGTSFTIGSLVTGATYYLRVQASNPFGQVSQLFSNTVATVTFNGGAPLGSLRGPLLAGSDSFLSGSIGSPGPSRQVLLRAPARTFPGDVSVQISTDAVAVPCPNSTQPTAPIGFSIAATPALQPTGSLYFTFDFAPGALDPIPTGRALLLRYEPVSGTCVPLETTVDTASRKMTARINHFSLFQVGSVPLSTTAETARLFPNPYYTGREGYLTIDNVPPQARVRIFTLRGERVLDVEANSAGLLTWGGTNGSGRAVASGVYLVVVESGGTKKILKLAVIR